MDILQNQKSSIMDKIVKKKDQILDDLGFSDDDENPLFDKNQMTPKDQRGQLIENFGIQIECPAFYYYNAKFVPHLQDHLVTMAFHIIPTNPKEVVQTTYQDGKIVENRFRGIYDMSGENAILALHEQDGRKGLKKKKELMLENLPKAIMKFSKSGSHFAIVKKYDETHDQDDELHVFDSRDIDQCFYDIEKDKPKFKVELNKEFNGETKLLQFDIHDKFVSVASKTTVQIFSLEQSSLGYAESNFKLNESKHDNILDIVLDSSKGNRYECHIAAKSSSITSIQFFDIKRPSKIRNISYIQKTENIIVRLSDNMNNAIFTNGHEHYLLQGEVQSSYPSLMKKKLRQAISEQDNFYLMACKDYDRDISILSTEDNQFDVVIPSNVEPGNLAVYDLMKDGNKLKTLAKIGENIIIDTIDLQKCNIGKPEEAILQVVEEKPYHSRSFNWPYYAYATKENMVYIHSAFNPNFIQRFEMPSNVSIIASTFLTDYQDCFIIVETNDEHFEVYQIDLDSSQPKVSEQPVLRYPFSKAIDKMVSNFHVRASTSKEKINLNKILQIFIQHQNLLWAWKGEDLELISDRAYNFEYFSDEAFFFQEESQINSGEIKIKSSNIKMVEIRYSMYETKMIYENKDSRVQVKNFAVDCTDKIIMLLTTDRNKNLNEENYISLIDIETEKLLIKIKVEDKEIIGRIMTNLFQFIGGHLYFNNRVIKMRYDLMLNPKLELDELQFFDHYSKVLKLGKDNDKIQTGYPLLSFHYHRLAYLIENQACLSAKKLLIMPYLHERKIHLNWRQKTDQFYTISNYKHTNFILCMCVNENKMYVYTQNGILCERIDYEHLAETCGEVIAVSEDAKTMIFKRPNQNSEISTVDVSVKGPKHLRTINIFNKAQMYMENQKNERLANKKKLEYLNKKFFVNQFSEDYLYELDVFWQNQLKGLKQPRKVKTTYNLNDMGDILVRIQPQIEKKKTQSQKEIANVPHTFGKDAVEECSIFYYFPNGKRKYKEFIYFDSTTDEVSNVLGSAINNKYMFFWNKTKVWSIELSSQSMNRLSLAIHEEASSQISRVRCTSNPDFVSIRVTQSQDTDIIINWDLKKDAQIDSFDVGSTAMTFQDQSGNIFIVDENKIVNCKSGCQLLCYKTRLSDFDWSNSQFQLLYGQRIDEKNHNWVIFRNMVNLGFSYMTFVIQEKFENNNLAPENLRFDIECFDYILNRNTYFTEDNGSVLDQDFKKINYLLKNYAALDPILLENLHYLDSSNKMALHYALENNNTRVVNVILKYMSEINYAAAHHIQDIFSELINYQNFELYLAECPFRTLQMESKETIKLLLTRDEASESDILACKGNGSSYVDDLFYIETMNEAPNSKRALTYATKINCIRADWIIQNKTGFMFLRELYRQQNKQIFVTTYMQILIEFLYSEYSNRIMRITMPPYFLHLIFVYLLIILSELERTQMEELNTDDENLTKISLWKDIVQLIAFIFNIINLLIFLMQTYYLRLTQFKRPWAYLDLIQLSANIVVSSSYFVKYDVIMLRQFEALLTITMTFKSLYFLRLVAEIAPLIDIIFIILYNIRWFVMVMVITQVSFSCAFYSIGRNQMQLADGDAKKIPSYSTYSGAFLFVYEQSLGIYNTAPYKNNEMTPVLILMFILSSFIMTLYLLNMLVGLMGESFGAGKQHKEANKKISQLGFVVDNWWIDAVQNKEKIVYLIAAYKVEEQNEMEEERFKELERRITQLGKQMMTEIKEVHSSIQHLAAQK